MSRAKGDLLRDASLGETRRGMNVVRLLFGETCCQLLQQSEINDAR
jgi:hypothetical protein